MSDHQTNKKLNVASERYSENTSLRTVIQVIPYIGGALDTLLSGKGTEIQKNRINHLLENISDRLNELESSNTIHATEEFYDLSLSVFEGAARSRSKEKRERFASILINQIAKESDWDEAETATRLLSSLEDIHIQVLMYAQTVPECTGAFVGLKVLTIVNKKSSTVGQVHPLSILSYFSNYSVSSLRMVCSELVAKGLLYDEGVGRLNIRSLEYFVSTDLSSWFLNWVSDKNA